jgi:hypothetical protein
VQIDVADRLLEERGRPVGTGDEPAASPWQPASTRLLVQRAVQLLDALAQALLDCLDDSHVAATCVAGGNCSQSVLETLATVADVPRKSAPPKQVEAAPWSRMPNT